MRLSTVREIVVEIAGVLLHITQYLHEVGLLMVSTRDGVGNDLTPEIQLMKQLAPEIGRRGRTRQSCARPRVRPSSPSHRPRLPSALPVLCLVNLVCESRRGDPACNRSGCEGLEIGGGGSIG